MSAALDERTLVGRAAAGDSGAFEQLIERHGRRTYRMLVRILGDSSDAEDVLQETLLKAWRALPRFRGEAQFNLAVPDRRQRGEPATRPGNAAPHAPARGHTCRGARSRAGTG